MDRRDQTRSHPPAEPGRSELWARVAVAVPAGALALFLVIEGGLIFTAGVLLFGIICLHELFAMFDRTEPPRLGAFLALAAMLLAAQYGGAGKLVLIMVAALPVLFAFTVAGRRPSAAGLAVALMGLWWIGLGLSHAVLLRGLPHGLGVIIDVMVGTFIGDTGAYLGGRMAGRTPLAASISPNKTIEGLAFGVLSAIVAVWLASRYQAWMPAKDALILGLGVGLAAPAGDLLESFVKRQAGVKDSGRAFGAHGGALDRMDALIFTVVVGYWIWLAFT